MLFNSYTFILIFLPLTLTGYFLINRKSHKHGKIWLIAMSLWFYAYFNHSYLPIIIASILFNYLMGKIITKEKKQPHRKTYLILTITTNLSALFYYKYLDFFIDNINHLFKANFNLLNILLPLAISFFTFKQIAYIVDCYRNEAPEYGIIDFSLFVVFFPQLIVGPILLHDELIPQYNDRTRKTINYENLAKGLMAFAIGLAKKVLLADTFGRAVDLGYSNITALNSTSAILVMLFYTLQIYFDFSGYCDMATGLGLMFNIDITQNFDSPYRAITITDFWKRWHITLTRFFRRYLYIPLGGNRKGKVRTYLNLFLVFLISGLWHGANFTFIIWGAVHGLFIVIHRAFAKQIDKIYPAVNWLLTFIFINITWIYFRSDSITQAHGLIKKIFAFDFGPAKTDLKAIFYVPEAILLNRLLPPAIFGEPLLYLLIITLFSLFAVIFMKNVNERIIKFKPKVISLITTVFLLVWSILSFTDVSNFIYIGF